MSSYFPSELPLPPGLNTPRLVLEPLQPRHVQLDYVAVMESRDYLRLWSGSPWPADDFTLADNLRDLQLHWREHQERAAFTYTVLNPARDICLGCVYLRPLDELAPFNPTQLADVAPDESLVRFWIRSLQQDSELERHLLETLLAWFRKDWSFKRILFETRVENGRQAQLFNSAPLQHVMTLQMPGRGGAHHFYIF